MDAELRESTNISCHDAIRELLLLFLFIVVLVAAVLAQPPVHDAHSAEAVLEPCLVSVVLLAPLSLFTRFCAGFWPARAVRGPTDGFGIAPVRAGGCTPPPDGTHSEKP